jgi:hypothetical protein
MGSVIITLSHGKVLADLILQWGEGTDNPSVTIENHSREDQIELGPIQRFPGSGVTIEHA